MSADATRVAAEPEIGTWPLLVALLGAPVVWVVHLGVSYFFVALDCGTSWDGAHTAVMITTVLSTVAAAGSGVFAWSRWKRARKHERQTLDPVHVREFLVVSGVLLAALFAGAIVLEGIAPLFVPLCG